MEEYEKFLNLEVCTENKGKYKITEYVSEGGNGFVFKCENQKGKTYILKILHCAKDIKIANFKKEINVLKNINSEYVVRCIDSGELIYSKKAKPRPFYIMEQYDSNLEMLINENKITPLVAYRYVIQICEGLKALHKREEPIIHRDLKPENILYDSKKDKVLICDLGLAHVGHNNTTINDAFAGNIDYHAPEQKLRGKHQIGTYTDIYSLGLIINVLFTKEIAQGEGYKKIWEVSPYFSFLDDIVGRMIRHDIETREHDINSVLLELEKYQLDNEFVDSFFKSVCKKNNIPSHKSIELMNLYGLLGFTVKKGINWEGVNLNYCCDYHFDCDQILRDSVLIKRTYERVKEKFEMEGRTYKGTEIPYHSLNMGENDDAELYHNFSKFLEGLKCFKEMEGKKNSCKKYFVGLETYHAIEFTQEIKRIQEEVDYYCKDAPILCVAWYVNKYLREFASWDYPITRYVILKKYELSFVNDKYQFSRKLNDDLIKFGKIIASKISNTTYIVKGNKIEICFEYFNEEEQFEELLQKAADSYEEHDNLRLDILDIIGSDEFIGLRKIYTLDSCDVNSIVTVLNLN